jgi:hypothetical protein
VVKEFDAALRRYRENRFVDRDITSCTGMSLRTWREAIKRKAVRTVHTGRGRGRVRICDAIALKRAAVISALNKTGLSLGVASQIALFVPNLTLLYTVCDPLVILCRRSADNDPKTGLPPRIERPLVNWFDLPLRTPKPTGSSRFSKTVSSGSVMTADPQIFLAICGSKLAVSLRGYRSAVIKLPAPLLNELPRCRLAVTSCGSLPNTKTPQGGLKKR